MNFESNIMQIIEKSNGIITSTYCKEHNIPTSYLSRMNKNGDLVKLARGVYGVKNTAEDEFFLFQYKYKKAVFSYESALYLLHAIDKIPQGFEISVPFGYKFNTKPESTIIHYVSKEIETLGVITATTIFGNTVRTYDYERTLCDIIQNQKTIESELYGKVIREYVKRVDKDIHKLFEYAQKLKILSKVQSIMEIVYE